MEAGPELATLAAPSTTKWPRLGIPKENRAFSPHLTLARAGGRIRLTPPHLRPTAPTVSSNICRKNCASLPAPEFGTMTAREFFLYQSQLSPKGSKYTKLASLI